MTRTRWEPQPDGSVTACVGAATLTVWRKYEGVEAWWQSANVDERTRISGIAHARWTLRGAKLRAQWMLRELRRDLAGART